MPGKLRVETEPKGMSADGCKLDFAAEADNTDVSGMMRRIQTRGSKASTTTFAEHHYPRLAVLVKSEKFETSMGALIFLNCITMGIGAETLIGRAQGWKELVLVCEHIFTLCFVSELALRVLVYGWRRYVPFIGETFDFLDGTVVMLTALLTYIAPLLRSAGSAGSNVFRVISILRVCRLMRLVRVVAKVRAFHEVWQLLRGLTESMRTLFWTIVIICFITYIFAVFGVVLISSELNALIEAAPEGAADPELETLMELFNGIFSTMQTLIQVLLLDSVHGILHPLMKYVGWSWLYVYSYIAMAVIVLLNLVTAIIVDNAMKNSQKDEQQALLEKEQDKKRQLAQFRALFELMDADGDGQLTWAEFESAFEVPEVATKLKMLDFEPESCRELFHLLDTGDGSLSLDEFFEGILSMDGNAKAKDSFKLLKVTGILQRSLQQFANDMQEDNQQLLQHTPGCKVTSRHGSLRSRSQNNEDSSVVYSPKSPSKRQVSEAAGQDLQLRPQDISVPGSPSFERECTIVIEEAMSPAMGSQRRLPSLPPATRECSVGVEGDMSPAIMGDSAMRRRLQLGTESFQLETTSDDAALLRVNEVAAQVANCNLKVDTLTANIANLQSSMALMLQRLDCQLLYDVSMRPR